MAEDTERDNIEEARNALRSGGKVIETTTRKREINAPPDIMADELKKDIPDPEDPSNAEIETATEAKEKNFRDLLVKIGEEAFDGWEIRVHRLGPPSYNGYPVNLSCIDTVTTGIKWDTLRDRIQTNHGGGEYKVWIKNENGRVVRTKTFSIPMDIPPILRQHECPGWWEEQEEQKKNKTEVAEKPPRIKSLEEELAAKTLQQQIKTVSEPREEGDSMIGKIYESQSALMRDLIARSAEKKDDTTLIAAMMSNQLETTKMVMTSIQESNKLQMQQMQAFMQMQMQMQQNRPPDNSAEFMKSMLEMTMQKGEVYAQMMMSMFPQVIEMLNQGKETENPTIAVAREIFSMASEGIQKLTQFYGASKEYMAMRDGLTKKQIAQSTVREKPEPDADATGELSVMEARRRFAKMDLPNKYLTIINAMAGDAYARTPYQSSSFCFFLLIPECPEKAQDMIMDSADALELKENLKKLTAGVPKAVLDMITEELEAKIYANAAAVKWLDGAIEYIGDELTKSGKYEIEEPEEEPTEEEPDEPEMQETKRSIPIVEEEPPKNGDHE